MNKINLLKSKKTLTNLTAKVFLLAGFLILKHSYRESAYNYIGSKEVNFLSLVTDDQTNKTYVLPATVQYSDCANNLKSIGLGCSPGVSIKRVTWPDNGYSTFGSGCSFRKFNVMIDCKELNGPRTYTIQVINKKL